MLEVTIKFYDLNGTRYWNFDCPLCEMKGDSSVISRGEAQRFVDKHMDEVHSVSDNKYKFVFLSVYPPSDRLKDLDTIGLAQIEHRIREGTASALDIRAKLYYDTSKEALAPGKHKDNVVAEGESEIDELIDNINKRVDDILVRFCDKFKLDRVNDASDELLTDGDGLGTKDKDSLEDFLWSDLKGTEKGAGTGTGTGAGVGTPPLQIDKPIIMCDRCGMPWDDRHEHYSRAAWFGIFHHRAFPKVAKRALKDATINAGLVGDGFVQVTRRKNKYYYKSINPSHIVILMNSEGDTE